MGSDDWEGYTKSANTHAPSSVQIPHVAGARALKKISPVQCIGEVHLQTHLIGLSQGNMQS